MSVELKDMPLKWFSGESKVLKKEVSIVMGKKDDLDARPEFIKEREVKSKERFEKEKDDDLMLFVNLVQKANQRRKVGRH